MAPQQNEELKAELVLKAAAVRDIMGFASERGIALREVLKGGVLSGQPVYFQSRHGPILNKGEGLSCHISPCILALDYPERQHATGSCLQSLQCYCIFPGCTLMLSTHHAPA